MPRAKLRHVAVCTENPEKTAAWYQEVFGLQDVGRTPSGGVYLSDGELSFAVLRIRASGNKSQVECGVSHFGFVVDDVEAMYRKLASVGSERQPDVPIHDQFFEAKFYAPDGVTVDVAEHGWLGAKGLEPLSEEPAQARLRHVAISTEDPEKTAAWYEDVFGLERAGYSPAGVYLTDGDINLAVLRIPSRADPSKPDLGMSHFGFMVADPDATMRKLAALGSERLPDVAIGNQYFEVKYVGPDDVTVDLGVHGWVGAKGLGLVHS